MTAPVPGPGKWWETFAGLTAWEDLKRMYLEQGRCPACGRPMFKRETCLECLQSLERVRQPLQAAGRKNQ